MWEGGGSFLLLIRLEASSEWWCTVVRTLRRERILTSAFKLVLAMEAASPRKFSLVFKLC